MRHCKLSSISETALCYIVGDISEAVIDTKYTGLGDMSIVIMELHYVNTEFR